MSLFAIVCADKPGALALRMATREAHLVFVRENLERLKLVGPLLDDAGDMAGSLLILEAEDLEAARAFAAADPYAVAGLFARVEIKAYRIAFGALA